MLFAAAAVARSGRVRLPVSLREGPRSYRGLRGGGDEHDRRLHPSPGVQQVRRASVAVISIGVRLSGGCSESCVAHPTTKYVAG